MLYYSNWKLVVIMIMVGLVVMNNSGPLLWVVRGGWAKNEPEIFNHWNGWCEVGGWLMGVVGCRAGR